MGWSVNWPVAANLTYLTPARDVKRNKQRTDMGLLLPYNSYQTGAMFERFQPQLRRQYETSE